MTNERMQAIFNLDVTKKFVLELFKFVASFSNLEERLKAEIAAKDHSACFKTTMDICAGLKKIYAGDLADEFYQTVNLLRNKPHEEIEMYLADFLVYVAMLSIDIQMALFKHDSNKVSEQIEASKAAESGLAQKLKLEKELLLAVDDTMLFLITLKTYLKDTGYNLQCLSGIEEVLEFLTKHRPGLIFLDVDMPKMNIDGFELAAKIRALGHDAPIVFLTGNASEKNVMKAMEMGAAGFIVKPANQSSILRILEKLVGLPERSQPQEKPAPKNTLSTANSPKLPDFPELRDLPK